MLFIILLSISSMGCLFEDKPLERKNMKVGELAYDILNPANHPKMWIEIDWMMAVEPEFNNEDLNEPLDSIEKVLSKTPLNPYSNRNNVELFKADDIQALPNAFILPKGEKIQQDNKIVQLDSTITIREPWTIGEIKKIEERFRTFGITEEVFSIYIIYVDGTYAVDPGTLGLAFSSSSIAIFKEAIDNISLDLLPPHLGIDEHRDIERAVLLHELGHLMGLADSSIESAVMHSSIDSTRFIDEIKGTFPMDYSSNSKIKLKNTLVGIKKTKMERINKGGDVAPTLSVELFPECDISGSGSSVKAEYWLSGDEPQVITMKKGEKTFTAAPISISPGTSIHFKITTIDAKGNKLVSSDIVIETDSIPLVDAEDETPGFSLAGLFVIIAVIFLFLSVLRDRPEGRNKG